MKRLVFIPCSGYGDLFGNNGMVHYFANIYDHIEYIIQVNPQDIPLGESMHHDLLHKIRFCQPSEVIIDDNTDIVNVSVSRDRDDMFKDRVCLERYYDFHHHYPIVQDDSPYNVYYNNASRFYTEIGLPQSFRLTKFNYVRRPDLETKTRNDILTKFNIMEGESYIIRTDYEPHIFYEDKIQSNKKQININNIHHDPLQLLLLIESSDEIHVLENSLALMIYHAQFSNIIKKVPVYFHEYCRKRYQIYQDMLKHPVLDNWTIYI
jgi:hypothetical protein